MNYQPRHELAEYLKPSEYIDSNHAKVSIIAQYCVEKAIHAFEQGQPGVYSDAELETA